MKQRLDIEATEKGLHEFHILTAESTFLVKTFFFLFFGFSIDVTAFTSTDPFIYGLLIFGIMLGLRYCYFILTTFKITPSPLVFISPRGLISILLFLQIAEVGFLKEVKTLVDERVLLVIILASMLAMTRGTMKKAKTAVEEINELEAPEEDTAIDILLQNEDNEKLPPGGAEKEE